MVSEKNPECIAKGACTYCGCDVASKVWEDLSCRHCYPDMMDAETWKQYKTKHNILINETE